MTTSLELCPLTAIAPVDGRYRNNCLPLADYFSEYATIRYRLKVEIEYFIALSAIGLPQLPTLSQQTIDALRSLYSAEEFTVEQARKVKEIEAVTNHDVKAVEYYLKEKFTGLGLEKYLEFIHFGLTSQDINNTAFPMALGDALTTVMLPAYAQLTDTLQEMAHQWAEIPMLARTHGQPASPTTLGKEFAVFAYRLNHLLDELKAMPMRAKFGGATGNFNAHRAAFPAIDWPAFAKQFLAANLGLERETNTTQISNYDGLGRCLTLLAAINTVIIDLDRDVWQYISMNYFKQRIKAGEVGSSAMPHKVNPIDFENSEGNMGMANAILNHLAGKLPVSRLQRDLTDSTVLRNLGVPLAQALTAVRSTLKGLGKLILNPDALAADLEDCWSVVAEGIQTILRREGFPKPYEALKALTRTNSKIDAEAIANFIDSLEGISEQVRAELHALSPQTYTGYAADFAYKS